MPIFSIFWKSLCKIGQKNLPVNPFGSGDLRNVFNYKFEGFFFFYKK